MPLYMDIDKLPEGTTADDIAQAHIADLRTQGKYDVEYVKYWSNHQCGKLFCLVHATDAESAQDVHREAHGLTAEKIIEVPPELAESFLGGGEINQAGAATLPGGQNRDLDPGIRTMLFTDIVGSTSLTQRFGDEAAMVWLRLHDDIVRTALSTFGGREVKHTGDGIMASFASAASAVKCATRIQSDLAKKQNEGETEALKVRIGVAAGEPVDHQNDLFGCTVQLAARLCAHAMAGQIIVSNVVAELCMGKGLSFEELGEDRPQRLRSTGASSRCALDPVTYQSKPSWFKIEAHHVGNLDESS